ncbi:MAG: glycosyltransferase [Candidatus Marinimicrobia bacterium]|nr:glycosyltransferase [Candidatus Neomarinimicrobiota bacterium]
MNTIQPFVSVIIPAYNAVGILPILLRALANQSYPVNQYEVIVVNDCSTDDTKDILLTSNFPSNFKIINHAKNQDRAATRNTGIRQSSSEILIFIDADMEVNADFIARHVTHFNNTNIMGIIGSLRPAPEIPLDKYQRYLFFGKRGVIKFPTGTPLPYQVFLFNNTSVRREVLEQVGFFDENLRLYGGEDAELAFRIYQKYPNGLFHDPDIQVIHHHFRLMNDALNILEKFGNAVVPYLIQKHPEMAKLYGIDYLGKCFPSENQRKNPFKIFTGLVLRQKVTISCLKGLFAVTPFPLSNGIVRLLMASALLRGICMNKKTDKFFC